jgi:hypothetical protein
MPGKDAPQDIVGSGGIVLPRPGQPAGDGGKDDE